MKNINKTTLVIVISALVIGITLGWLLFGRSSETDLIHQDNETAIATQTVWTCSMHPQIRQNEPGNCPICGMELIPLGDENSSIDPMAIRMSPTAMQLAQVQTMVVGSSDAEKSIRLAGKVQADERLLYTQSSHIPGRVEKLAINFTGEYISKGEVIAYLYSPDLVTAQEELLQAQKIKATQPALFNAANEKLKNWKLTEEQIKGIVSSNTIIEEFPILANVSGYVTKKMVNRGDYIRQGQPIYEIADLSKVWILFDVYESDMSWIRKGDEVSFTIQSLPGENYTGRINYIDPVIDPKTRVAKARIEAPNKRMELKPEMFVTGTVISQIDTKTSSITIPKSAVMWTGKRSVVYVMQNTSEGIGFAMREVTLGPEIGGGFLIESGLTPGEEIAVNGTFSIDAAAQLAGKPSMMNPEGGVQMTGHNHGGDTKGQATSSNKEASNVPNNGSAVEVSSAAKNNLLPMFNTYFDMKTALTKDDFEKAKETGIRLKTEVGEVNMNLFQGDAHNFWMKQAGLLTTGLEHIEQLEDIKQLRDKFIGISTAMIAIADTFQPFHAPIYVQRCPMADSNKGANWLSRSEVIENPYFGASMFSCGEVIKTIEEID